MAQTILIKRSTSTAAPTSLSNGELAYSHVSGTGKLYIGRPGGGSGDIDAIGGKHYTDIITAATAANTAGKLVLRDGSGNFASNVITANSFVGPLTGTVTGGTYNSGLGELTLDNSDGSNVIITGFTSGGGGSPLQVGDGTTTVSNVTGITFTNASVVSSSLPVTYNWNFGDGGTSTLVSPSYTYDTLGTFIIRLTATPTKCPQLSRFVQKQIIVQKSPDNMKYPPVNAIA